MKTNECIMNGICVTKTICCTAAILLTNDVEILYKCRTETRSFSFGTVPRGYFRKKFGGSPGYSIQYCPLCGKKFPAELDDYREEILKREFGLNLYTEDSEINPLVPTEFLTDQWWISRQNYPDFPIRNKTEFEEEEARILNYDDLTTDEKAQEIKKLIKNTIEYENTISATDLGGFCCYPFKIQVEGWCDDCQGNSCSEYPIIYEREKRRYRLTNIPPRYLLRDKFWKRQPRRELFVNIFYCPRCGQKLKESLASRWYKEIHEKFGVYDILSKSQMAKVPQKYLTDEWWKELGL